MLELSKTGQFDELLKQLHRYAELGCFEQQSGQRVRSRSDQIA